MNDESQEYMREWARDNGKSVRQRTVRQETTKGKAGTLPHNMYERTQPIGEKLQFSTPSADDISTFGKHQVVTSLVVHNHRSLTRFL